MEKYPDTNTTQTSEGKIKMKNDQTIKLPVVCFNFICDQSHRNVITNVDQQFQKPIPLWKTSHNMRMAVAAVQIHVLQARVQFLDVAFLSVSHIFITAKQASKLQNGSKIFHLLEYMSNFYRNSNLPSILGEKKSSGFVTS